jgi:hypothetical protein
MVCEGYGSVLLGRRKRLPASWSRGGRDRAAPVAFHVRNGLVFGGPPHRQLPIRQPNFHHQRPRRGLRLKPIDAGIRR